MSNFSNPHHKSYPLSISLKPRILFISTCACSVLIVCSHILQEYGFLLQKDFFLIKKKNTSGPNRKSRMFPLITVHLRTSLVCLKKYLRRKEIQIL